ncbi:GWxTD domain-containing protein [candidate division KSB1 bacterium]|nr:GWxTD domain-containing protein [candidate division KSB1 bacterium]
MKALSVILLVMLIITQGLLAQEEMGRYRNEDVPEFYYDIINVASSETGKSRINLYFEIPYDELQFVRTDSSYIAKYELTVVVYDKDGEQVDGKIWEEAIEVTNYSLTNSRKNYSLTNTFFHLDPDDIRVSIGLMDLDTQKTGFRKTRLDLRDFSDQKFAVSDVTFTDQLEIDSLGIKSIHPQVADYIRATGSQLFCYFEIYSTDTKKNQAFDISYTLTDSKKHEVLKESYLRRRDSSRTMEYFAIDRSVLTHGRYTLEVDVKQGRREDKVKKAFILRWAGAPSTVSDLTLAIQQLRYIAKNSELKELMKAPEDEKLDNFKEFWQKRDPSPGTEKNELMNEYYRRIEYANENFSGFREGWISDMGMIYIIFGPPSDIERHPFEREYKPYEIWYYYHINRQFVFVDESGFGDYRLSNPYNWRNWQDGIYY